MNASKKLLSLAVVSLTPAIASASYIYYTNLGNFLFDDDGNGSIDRTLATPGFQSTDIGLVGDWNGDGVDEIGFTRRGAAPNESWSWNLSSNNTDFNTLHTPSFVNGEGRNVGTGADTYLFNGEDWPRDVPIVGDWDGDGTDEIGLFRFNNTTTINWILFDGNTGTAGVSTTYLHGGPNQPDLPLIGDPDGDGDDNAGLQRGDGVWIANATDGAGGVFNFTGPHGSRNAGDISVLGDFSGDGADEYMMYRGSTGQWLIADDFTIAGAVGAGGLVESVVATDVNSVLGVGEEVNYAWFGNTVPEPGTYALFAGLLALSSIAIRRRER